MKKDERIIQFYDFVVKSTAKNLSKVPTISAKKFFKLIDTIPINQRIKSVRHGREFYYISDWKWSGDILTVLVNKSDKGMSDPVFSDPETGHRRTAKKNGKEGQDFSAHLVIKFPKNDLDPALVLVEKCIGLGTYHIARLFDQIIRDVKKINPKEFKIKHPDGSSDKSGSPKMLTVGYHSSFEGHVSKQFINDLEKGTIQSLELITERNKHNKFDSQGYMTEKATVLNISVKDDGGWSKKFQTIARSIKKRSKDYEKARVRFKYESGAPGMVDVETDSGAADGFTKKSRITSPNELESSYDIICNDIARRMKSLL